MGRDRFGEIGEEVKEALETAIARVGRSYRARREKEAQKLRDDKERADQADSDMSDGQSRPDVDVDKPSKPNNGPVRGDGTPDNPYVYELRPRKDWTPEQHDEFIDKVSHINASNPRKIDPSDVDPRSSGFRDRYMDDIVERYLRENPELKGDRDFTDAFRDELRRQLDGKDIDHAVELQVGGLDDLENALPLDSSVNRSTGAQIAAILRRIEEDSYFRFDIDWLNPRD